MTELSELLAGSSCGSIEGIDVEGIDSAEIRLIVVDMDGTLLDDQGRIPERTWPLIDDLRSRGIVFSPASGRQYATLRSLFARGPETSSGTDPACRTEGMVFIAENGTVVGRDENLLSVTALPSGIAEGILATVRELTAAGRDVGAVLCCPDMAYTERSDEAFLAEARTYYHALEIVEDFETVLRDSRAEGSRAVAPVKLAIFDFAEIAEVTAPALGSWTDRAQVVISGRHWMDIMALGIDKGVGVRRLQEELGIGPDQTLAFGDYLNDVEMLDRATHSFAMANAHPQVLARARYRAPANTENGVAQVLTALFAPR